MQSSGEGFFLLVWSEYPPEGPMNTDSDWIDHWIVFENYEDAYEQWDGLRSKELVASASLCVPIQSTDYASNNNRRKLHYGERHDQNIWN